MSNPVALVPEAREKKKPQLVVAATGIRSQLRLPGLGRVPDDLLSIFTRQLAALVSAGVPHHRALALLATQTEHQGLKQVLLEVYHEVCCGSPFSVSASNHAEVFSPLYTGMLRVGEVHGDMPMILRSLADYLEGEMRTKKKIKQAMSYPFLVLSITGVFTLFIFNYILPYFVNIFESMHIELPAITKVLIFLVRLLNNPVPCIFLMLILACVGYGLKCYVAAPEGRLMWDEYKLRLPVVGELLRKIAISRFARSLALLLGGGVPLTITIQHAAESTGNAAYEKFCEGARDALLNGRQVHQFFATDDFLFPINFPRMLSVGETSGKLEQVCEKLSKAYEEEVQYALQAFLSTIEPILVMITGGVIGLIILAIFLPLYGYMNQL